MNNGLRLARVARYHPGAHSADVICLDDGYRYPRVPVLCPTASTDTGDYDVPSVEPLGAEDGAGRFAARAAVAVLGFLHRTPVIVGFLTPPQSAMLFDEPDRHVRRFASDLYFTADGDGNCELAHPSGSYVRIGEDPTHEDLTGLDRNGRWAIGRNTARAPHVRVVVANGGAVKATVSIAPSGDVLVDTVGKMDMVVAGSLTATIGGTLSADVAGAATVTTPSATVDAPTTTITGNVSIGGNLAVAGAAAVTGAVSSATAVSDPAGSMAAIRSTFNSHDHSNPEGGNVGPPSPTM